MQKPHRWLRMIVYLEAQLSIIQTRVSESECFDSPAPPQVSNKKDSSDNSVKGRNDKVHFGGKGSVVFVMKLIPILRKSLQLVGSFLQCPERIEGIWFVKRKYVCNV